MFSAQPKLGIIAHTAGSQELHESAGCLTHIVQKAGWSYEWLCFRASGGPKNSTGYDALYIQGGSFSAATFGAEPWMAQEMNLIEDALQRNIPVIGICLGANLIGRILGAQMSQLLPEGGQLGYRLIEPTERGQRILDKPFFSFCWHKQRLVLPVGATRLAYSEGEPVAYSYGRALALQVHLDWTPNIIRLLTTPENLNSSGVATMDSRAKINSDIVRHGDEACRPLDALIHTWLGNSREGL